MKIARRILTVLLCLALFTTTALAADASLDREISETAETLAHFDGKSALTNQKAFPAGSSLSDWTAIALARSGQPGDYEKYAKALKKYVEETYAEQGCLDEVRATEYHRTILTALALGEDPAAFGSGIDLTVDGIYQFPGGIGDQGLNGVCYGLIALHAAGSEAPENASYTEEVLVQMLLDAQETDGGFGLTKGSSEVDITAMALQALAPCKDRYADEIQAALSYLAGQMNDSCGFSREGEDSAESIAQVILALCALELDPQEDMRFVRGRTDLLTSLARFRGDDGAYRHMTDSPESDCYTTAQCLLALTAVRRLCSGEAGVFQFEADPGPNQKTTSQWIYIAAAVIFVAVAAIGIVILRKRKQHAETY